MVIIAAATSHTYRQRNPRRSPLYKIIAEHFAEFKRVYEERFQETHGFWRVEIEDAVEAFLVCGLFEYGFAHVRCRDCEHEMVVPFSCKARCLCPSCQQKRAVWWAEWLVDEVLFSVDHRQFVFTIPKILRGYFRQNPHLLGDLAKCAWLALKEFFLTIDPQAVPASIFCIQSFGNLLNY